MWTGVLSRWRKQSQELHDSRCLSKCSEVGQIKFSSPSQLHGWQLFCRLWRVPSLDPYFFYPFHLSTDIPSIWHFQQRSHHFWSWKNHLNICILPTVCSPKATFNISKVSAAFSYFQRTSDADMQLCQGCHY